MIGVAKATSCRRVLPRVKSCFSADIAALLVSQPGTWAVRPDPRPTGEGPPSDGSAGLRGCSVLGRLRAVRGPLGVERAGLVNALVGVRAEEVALALDQGRGQPLGT